MPKVTMPQLGESVAEGTIGKWLKKVGDHVDKYEPIVEVITDKVNAEVPSPFEGTLQQILAEEGATVPNGAEIAVIEAAGEAVASVAPGAAPAGAEAKAPVASVAPGAAPAGAEAKAPVASLLAGAAPEATAEEVGPAERTVLGPAEPAGAGAAEYDGRMTPAVRRLAREHAVDLNQVPGTGHAGRVTREDVLQYVERQRAGEVAPALPRATAATAAPAPAPVRAAASAPATAPASPGPSPVAAGDSLKPQTPMRRAIAAQMTRALQVPAAYTTIEVDMAAVVALRDRLKSDYQAREGIGLSYVAFVAKAVVEALKRHPDINGHWADEGLWRRKAINLGIAVALDDGLVVPVVHGADGLSLHGLNRAINELAERARANRLRLDDVQGGTFTVDNTGWTGSVLTQPIINVPEVAILTMEAIVKRPVVIETPQGDVLGIRPVMNMCLGFDHRATDGAQAGRFVQEVRRWLEGVTADTAVW